MAKASKPKPGKKPDKPKPGKKPAMVEATSGATIGATKDGNAIQCAANETE